jgi:F-type H+-transporting ATPase subunit gamma
LRGEQDAETVQVVTGRKSEAFFRFQGIGYEEAFTGFSDSPTYEDAQRVGRYLTQLFEDEEADEVYLIYNRYQSALVQRPVVTRLLPVAPEDDEEENEEDGQNIPLEFIPGPEVLLQRLVPKYVETLLFRAFLESAAGEHGARMTAMKSASDSANEMSEDLTKQMNRMRQAQITQEILEIVGGAEALAG